MDLADATRQPIPVPLAGRTYHVQPRTLAELGPLQAWFKRTIPGPLVRAGEAIEQGRRLKAGMGPVVEMLLIEQAQRAHLAWPPTVGSFAWLDAVDRAEQVAEVIRFGLTPLHPEVDIEAARQIYQDAQPGELGVFVCVLFEGRRPDPKEQTGPTPTTTPTSTPNRPNPNVTTPNPSSSTSA